MLAADPTAVFSSVASDGVVKGGSYYWFTVTYSDDVAIDYRTIGNGDVQVTGPGSYSEPGTLSNLTRSGGSWAATYRVPAPGGAWDASDNGMYSISTRPREVADTSGTFVNDEEIGQMFVDIDNPSAPTAWLEAADVTGGGASSYWFKVSYADDEGIDYRTIDGNDVVITGPNGYSQPSVLSNLTVADGEWTATYRITAAGGTWDRGDNGTYVVTMAGGEVLDRSGHAAAPGALGQFQVTIPDGLRPTAAMDAKSVDTAGGANYWFQVHYFDDSAIDYRSIDGHDVQVSGPGGFSAAGVLSSLGFSAGAWTATYRIAAPGGGWDAADNGTYTVMLKPNQVFDTAGNSVATKELGTFQVLVPAPPTGPIALAGVLSPFSDVSIVDQTLGVTSH